VDFLKHSNSSSTENVAKEENALFLLILGLVSFYIKVLLDFFSFPNAAHWF